MKSRTSTSAASRKEGIKKPETREKRFPSRSISLPKTSSRVSSGSIQVEERRAQGGSSISAKIVEGEGGGRRTRGRTRKGGTREEEEGKTGKGARSKYVGQQGGAGTARHTPMQQLH